jgi:hypothetical protein
MIFLGVFVKKVTSGSRKTIQNTQFLPLELKSYFTNYKNDSSFQFTGGGKNDGGKSFN